MERYSYIGKTKEEAIEEGLKDLNIKESDIITKELETKSGLFKSKKIEVQIIKKSDIVKFIKNTLDNIIKSMGMEANYEVKTREETPTITVFSNNNNILIGKNGRTIDALSTVVKQAVQNELGFYYNFVLDVGDYKVKQQKRLERMAKSVAKDVIKTQMEVKLDPMNSYERRLIHSALSNYSKVRTESTGEEPNRCVVIKPVEEENN